MTTDVCTVCCDPRLVGDPVDTLTGAVVDQTLDFRLIGPIELRWYRYYDSGQNERSFAHGWGFANEYDRRLHADGNGFTLCEPVGNDTVFPWLPKDGDTASNAGATLRRVSLRCYQVTRHLKPAMEFTFDPPNSVARLTRLLQGSHEVRFEVASNLRLERIVDSVGRRILVTEDENGQLVRLAWQCESDGDDQPLMTYHYDERRNLVATRNGADSGHDYAYDEANRMVMRRGRLGFTFRFGYDVQGRCVIAVGDDRLHSVALNYRAPDRLTEVTRPDLGVWHYRFNAQRSLHEIQDPHGGVRKFVRGLHGQPLFEVDPNGNRTRFVCDAAGATISKIDPFGFQHQLPEDPNRSEPRLRRVAGLPVEYQYGDLLDPEQVRLPDVEQAVRLLSPSRATLAVTRAGDFIRPTEVLVRPLGYQWWPAPAVGRVFSDLGKLVEQFDDVGQRRRWRYDKAGNLSDFVDFGGSHWTYDHGTWHFLQRVVNPLGHECRYRHTTSGEIKSFEDGLGSLSEYGYDLCDRLVEVRRHGVVRERYLRDAAGNLVSKCATDGRELLRVEIGPRNLPLKRLLASGDIQEFSYDRHGRLRSASNHAGIVEWTYDTLGNATSDKRDGQGVDDTYAGHMVLLEARFFDRFVIRYDRSKNGDIDVIDPGGACHRLRVMPHGFVHCQFANGSAELAQFDALGRCLFKSLERPGQPHWIRHYRWTGEGQLREVDDSLLGNVRHDYDAAHRLQRRHIGGRTEEYVFDAADNLVAQPGLVDVSLLQGNRLATANGQRFTFNDRNHVASRQTAAGLVTYHYDSRDQLVAIDMPAGRWEAEYDTVGRRVRKRWQDQVTEFFWRGDQLIAERSAEGRLRLYIHVDGLAQTPLLILDYASIASGPGECERLVVCSDQLGTPCLLEDDARSEAWRAICAPMGATEIVPTAKATCHLRFPGHYLDIETGLHYNRFRYYDPVLGRYLQSDPWGIAGGNNLYAYQPNPLLKADVRGLGDEHAKSPKEGEADAEATAKGQAGKRDPLADMSPEDLQNHCKQRADELHNQMKNPRDKEGVTIAVTVVQQKDQPETRRVIVSTSRDDGSLPPGCGPLHPNEEIGTGGPLLRTRNAPKDENGQTPKRLKLTEHESGGVTAEMVPQQRTYEVDSKTGEGTLYNKRSAQNPEGESRHHAEQRAQSSLKPNEEVVAMSPGGRPCCPGCQTALGDNLSKVPPDRRGT